MEFIADDLLSFLAGWLIHHVLGEDQSMARQIHAIDGGMTPEQAYREAGGYRTAPSEEALTRLPKPGPCAGWTSRPTRSSCSVNLFP
jgi:hypothetical protein